MNERIKDMSDKGDGNQNPQNTKILQLGFNISVSGDPGTDYQIVLDEKEQAFGQPSIQKEIQPQGLAQLKDSETKSTKDEVEIKKNLLEDKESEPTGAIPKQRTQLRDTALTKTSTMSKSEKTCSSLQSDLSIINDIKTAMEHFDKFSDHIKDIPRLKTRPIATSTPISDKENSKSESSLVYPEYRSKRFPHLYDFNLRKDYFRGSVKPLPPDLFLKPLPGENFYKRSIVNRYFDWESYKQYRSVDNISASETKRKCDADKDDFQSTTNEGPPGILKKSDSESGDKQSTSSTDSVKDIKIYQSGGILIMQNFKETFDINDRKEISEFSAKLIENCNKLKEEINTEYINMDKKMLVGSSSEECKSSGKMVQFDLSSSDNRKSKSEESLSIKMESPESTNEAIKMKDFSPQETPQSQEFPSISTQENDSVISNQPGTSPTYGGSKKLEWDSGADVGYLNLDLSKENLSTIERIVLKGLSSDGLHEKNVVYEKKPEQTNSKFILERMPSDNGLVEIAEGQIKIEEKTTTLKVSQNGKKQIEDEKKVREEVTEISSKNMCKDEKKILPEELQSGEKILKKKPSKESKPKRKISQSTDKSVFVNTLFKESDYRTEDCKIIESPKFRSSRVSPKVKKLRKKKTSTGYKSNLTAPLKEKIDTIIDIARCSARSNDGSSLEIGIPKTVYRKLDSEFNDVEQAKEVEEIIIDQRFKIKQNVDISRKMGKAIPFEDTDYKKEKKNKARPVSASSSSINTVLQNNENKEENELKVEQNKFIDQNIQTNQSEMESVGIQAFASQKSSVCDLKIPRNHISEKVAKVTRAESVNTSSKNIQAFGLNSSLPKQLAHPKETKVSENQNTKSTQFFGGPINSLPNYHSNLIIKPVESCGRMLKVLKPKRNLETENILLKEENKKNILGNDDCFKEGKPELDSLRRNNKANKENVITQKSASSKRNRNVTSQKSSKSSGFNLDSLEISQNQTQEQEKTSDCFPLSDVSSKVLTTEVLREHCDSIDRNIIQEKYFQSQLVEFERKNMMLKSTSADEIYNVNKNLKKSVTVACQYSPQPKNNESDKKFKNQGRQDTCDKDKKGNNKTNSQQKSFRQDLEIEERCDIFGTGDSLPSNTQTPHSSISENQDSRENNTNGVGRAKSFEYLPGHVYENSENIRKLSSDTEKNLITCSSSGSSNFKATAKRSSSDQLRNSEGRSTLVLENSTTESSFDSGPIKVLDDNLTQLNLVVSRLWEKDAQVHTISQALLVNLRKKNGSGDCYRDLALQSNSPKTEGSDNPVTSCETQKDRGDVSLVADSVNIKKKTKEHEISVGCQTEEKSLLTNSGKMHEERKALEKRINEEKISQIKWIENEIYHLNILRGLLEKQNSSSHNKKKLPMSLPSNGTSKSQEKYEKNNLTEVHSESVTPVYGCTISVLENKVPENNSPCSERESSPSTPEENGVHYSISEGVKYGMSVSLTGGSKNMRKVIMFPVGVQVSIKNDGTECENDGVGNDSNLGIQQSNGSLEHQNPCNQWSHSNVNTQYPSLKRNSENFPSTSAQTNFPPVKKCALCDMENCVCLDLSEKSCESPSRSPRSKSRSSDKRNSVKLCFGENEGVNESKSTYNLTDEVIREIACCSPVNNRDSEKRSDNDFLETLRRRKTMQSPSIKCEACQNKIVSNTSKSGIVCRGLCQSNIYLNCEKSSDNSGSCKCSKVQVQKSSSCACHVIKIHGPKCCSAESGTCSCRRKTQLKKMENQSCQTDDITVERKDLIENPEIINATKEPGVFCPTEQKISMESKTPIVEKYSCDPKNSYEKRHSWDSKLEMKQKSGLERLSPGEGIAVRMKTPVPPIFCHCKKKSSEEKPKVDEHPRHYFLKIEETEIDESCESVERRKSLEVITVTVPVKRAGKAKIYGKKIQQSYQSTSSLESFKNYSEKGCKCCEECLHRLCEKLTKEYDSRSNGELLMTEAEKPQSPKRPSRTQPTECDSYEDIEKYKRDNYNGEVFHPQASSLEDCYQNKNHTEYEQSESLCFDRPENGSSKAWIEDCGCLKANDLSDYDSHKKCRDGRFFAEEKKQGYENGREYEARQKVSRFNSSHYEPEKERSSRSKYNPYNPDYYNYNKREFMTKSELMKEKESKRKIHHPTLQECLASNRPDFFSSAENRRRIISERAKERTQKHNTRMECLMNLIHKCNEREQYKNKTEGAKRIFTTSQMKEQTMKRYKKLPEVTEKIANQKKQEEYKTNKLMADIFAKKIQLAAIKGHINLSNSVSVLSTI